MRCTSIPAMAAEAAYDLLFKFIVIGDASVGKSCLLHYFLEHKFRKTDSHTIGVEFGSQMLTVGGRRVKLQIWDTAGQERFRSVTRSYYRGASAALLVYDVSDRDSYNHMSAWLEDAKALGRSDIALVLVGNKCDKEQAREVSLLEASRFAQEHHLLFFETSCATGECVDDVFMACVKSIMSKIESGHIDEDTLTTGVPEWNTTESQAGCCQ